MLRMIDWCLRYSSMIPTGSPNAFTTWLLSSMSKGINVDSILPWSLYCFSWHRTLGMRKASMFANRQRGPCGCCGSCCWQALFHSTPYRCRDEVVASHDSVWWPRIEYTVYHFKCSARWVDPTEWCRHGGELHSCHQISQAVLHIISHAMKKIMIVMTVIVKVRVHWVIDVLTTTTSNMVLRTLNWMIMKPGCATIRI